MPRTAVITQPTYLPWLGYFEQIARADVFVFLDTVQFVPRSWQCRNRILGPDRQPFWLSVPVASHARECAINEIIIAPDQPQWREKHLRSLRHNLGRTAHFSEEFPAIEEWLGSASGRLADMNIAGIRLLAGRLGLAPKFLRASDLEARGRNIDLLLAICREVGADRYYSSLGSKVYIDDDPEAFARNGIELVYQTWPHPAYEQGGGEFVSHLSAVDAIFRLGGKAVRSLLA